MLLNNVTSLYFFFFLQRQLIGVTFVANVFEVCSNWHRCLQRNVILYQSRVSLIKRQCHSDMKAQLGSTTTVISALLFCS